MTSQEIIEVQNKIACLILDNAPAECKIFRINIEMKFDDDNELDRCSRIVYCYTGEDLEYERNYLPSDDFDDELCEYFEKLNNLFVVQGERWKVCDFIVSDAGKFKINYSYDLSPRISGDPFAGSRDPRPKIEPYI